MGASGGIRDLAAGLGGPDLLGMVGLPAAAVDADEDCLGLLGVVEAAAGWPDSPSAFKLLIDVIGSAFSSSSASLFYFLSASFSDSLSSAALASSASSSTLIFILFGSAIFSFDLAESAEPVYPASSSTSCWAYVVANACALN